MEQINKINGKSVALSSFLDLDSKVLISDESVIYLKNTTDVSGDSEITFELDVNAKLDLTIFDFSLAATAHQNLNFNLQENSSLKMVYVCLNSGTTKNQITANLNGQQAQADINVISVANHGVNTEFDVVCNNNAPFTNGNITQRAVALSGGQNIFNATGYIGKDCSKAVNFQESRALLLDGAAKGDASPILLINHHDVEAGHAAGVSRVNDDEMYYLMSRGIDRKSAEQLMTVAFIRPVVDKITDLDLRESVFDKIREKASYEID
ncbi:SufD family Fe-S cluster assembly protein [Mollicutes bacterium LVI A0039]|nr:SufD family Fe-S cluster assembly protein [Mollicutes bacterium LVI A0039]